MRREPILLSKEEFALLTEDEQSQYGEALEVEQTLGSLLNYMQAISPEVKAYPHLKLLCETIDALIEHRLYKDGPGPYAVRNAQGIYVHPVTGERAIRFLQIDEPPGHGKSFCVSDHLPSYYVTNYPDRKACVASYEADFAREWGGKAMQHILDNPQFGITVSKKKQAQDNWGIEGKKGGMFTAGVGGPITGKRFHLGIVDDPIKNQDDAMSETMRKRNRNWWATSFLTRQHPDGETVFILMATRWHEDDLSGQLTASEPDKWYRLSLPAIAFDTVDDEGFSVDEETGKRDPLNRRPGEVLCPEMWPHEVLLDIKGGQGEMWFQAMFQGKPSIAAGNKFKKFDSKWSLVNGFYTLKCADGSVEVVHESKCYRIATVDTAATEKTSADYSVFAVYDVTPSHKLILRYIKRERIDSSKHTEWFTKLYEKWHPKFAVVEAKTYGLTLWQNIRRLGRYSILRSDMPGDKEAKAQPATEAVNNDQLYLPEEAEWRQAWIDEHKKFPNGGHDDMVDTTAIAVDRYNLMTPWQSETVIESISMEARIEKYVDSMNDPKVDHPEIGYW